MVDSMVDLEGFGVMFTKLAIVLGAPMSLHSVGYDTTVHIPSFAAYMSVFFFSDIQTADAYIII